MTDDTEAAVLTLARLFGATIRPEHLAEVVAAWDGMVPHVEAVRAIDLPPEAEPAALFRP